jgi:hypothetical protein
MTLSGARAHGAAKWKTGLDGAEFSGDFRLSAGVLHIRIMRPDRFDWGLGDYSTASIKLLPIAPREP